MRGHSLFTTAFVLLTAAGTSWGSDAWILKDLHSKQHAPFAAKQTKAIVLVFVATDCPIANYYQPTLAKLTTDYMEQHVPFFLLHADPDAKSDAMIKHAKEFKTKAPVVWDRDQTFAKRVDARKTPEAFLIDRKGKTLYRGRINDLYADYGKRRKAARTHDLKDALDAFLSGQAIKNAATQAIGCHIPYPKKKQTAAP